MWRRAQVHWESGQPGVIAINPIGLRSMKSKWAKKGKESVPAPKEGARKQGRRFMYYTVLKIRICDRPSTIDLAGCLDCHVTLSKLGS